MKWGGSGEFRAQLDFKRITRMNADVKELYSAILFGNDNNVALETVLESDKTKKLSFRFDHIYHHVHFIPLNQYGIRLLKILTRPNWKEILLTTLMPPEVHKKRLGIMEYDGYWEGLYMYCFADNDIARFIRFRDALDDTDESFEVLCFPWQVEFFKKCLGDRVQLNVCSMDRAEEALGLSPM